LTAFCCHRGRAWPHSWCTAEAARSPAPSIPVRKYYPARRRHFPLDVPEQCCGLSLPTLTREVRQMTTASGQPTSCKPDPCELAHNDCLLGATNEVLGDFFGVTRRTIPELDRQGRAVATPWSPAPCSSAPRASARKRPAERAERAETPCKNPACRIRRRFQSSLRAAAAGLRRPARRKLAETGGNSRQKLCSRPVRTFAVPLLGATPDPDWRIACGNCGNCEIGRPADGSKQWMPARGDQRFSLQCFLPNPFKDLAGPRAIILRPHSDRHRTVTSS
jgi:hypothetical protein